MNEESIEEVLDPRLIEDSDDFEVIDLEDVEENSSPQQVAQPQIMGRRNKRHYARIMSKIKPKISSRPKLSTLLERIKERAIN